MFQRSADFKQASKRQLEVWQKNFPPGTEERQEIRDELQYREYAWLYGEKNAMEMMNTLIIARTKYNQRKASYEEMVVEQCEIDWDSLPPIESRD